jgi:DNA ligase 1
MVSNESESDGSSFLQFARTCDRIKSTNSKLEKVAILAEYLNGLNSDKDLRIAITFLSGRIFPPGGLEQEVNVGYSILWNTISTLFTLSHEDLSKYYMKHGDLGAATEEVFAERKNANPFAILLKNKLTLANVFSGFKEIARTTGSGSQEKKVQILRGLFSSGSPIESKYLVKVLASEMRIGLVEGLVEEALAKQFGKSLEEIRLANLILADPGLVAISAKHERLYEARIQPLRPTNFMLAQAAANAEGLFSSFESMPVLSEFKYDGIRAQIHYSQGEIKIFSRNLADVARFFPELNQGMGRFSDSELILDGEIVAFDKGRPLPFQLLQRRLRKISRSGSDSPIRYFAFDLLYHRKPMIDLPLAERVAVLRKLGVNEDYVTFSNQREVSSSQEIQLMFDESRALGYEGLVVKDPRSKYTPGRRGKNWIKLKKELDTLDVVIVAAEYGHGKRARRISDYTFAVGDEGELKVVGKAYSGLTDSEIEGMTKLLKSIATNDAGYRFDVKPQVILEVAFDAVQRSDRHDSGFALRFPRIKRIRTDKSLKDIDTLQHVREIYESQKLKL